MGVSPEIGRTFSESDDRRGCGAEGSLAVLSHGFWQTHYGGDPDALGRTILLDGHPFTVIGVTPVRFFGLRVGQSFDVVLPICSEAVLRGTLSGLDERSFWWLEVMGRLKSGSTIDQAQASLRSMQTSIREATLPANWPEEYLRDYLKEPFTLTAGHAGVSQLRTRYSQALFVLMGVVALVLLLASTNIANLLLARAAARSKEIAVRLSLGASRSRLVRQLLIESSILGLLGAAAGIVVARWASQFLVYQLSTGTTRVFLDVSFDQRVLGFTAGVGLLTGLFFGIFPALRATGTAPIQTLREMSRSASATDVKMGLGRFLVAVQVGLSLVLLLGAALFIRSYSALTSLDPGFDRSNVLVVSVDVRGAGAAEDQRLPLFDRILEAVRAVPGVRAAATSALTPLSGAIWNHAIQVDGYESKSERDSIAYYNFVSADYFKTLGTLFVSGRDLNSQDTAKSPKVAIVNEALVKKFFGARDPIGAIYRIRQEQIWEDVQVMGVVRDAKYRNLRDPVPPTAYAPIAQMREPRPFVSLSIQGAGDPGSLRPSVVSAISGVHSDIALTFRTLQSQVSDSLVQERLMATLSALFGVLALLVAAVGLSGLVSYSVSRRRAEMGIRAALGASPGSLVRLVLRDVVWLTALGLILGAAAGLASGRFVSGLLYGLQPYDAATLVVSAALLGFIALVAGYVPARRAARVDPIESLRTE